MQANSGFKYGRKNKPKNKRANADANSGSVEEPTRQKTPPHPRLSYPILSSALRTVTVLKRPHPNLPTRALTLRITSSPLTAHACTPRFFRPCMTGSLTMMSSEMFFSARCK
jgi:hypothetical protein